MVDSRVGVIQKKLENDFQQNFGNMIKDRLDNIINVIQNEQNTDDLNLNDELFSSSQFINK